MMRAGGRRKRQESARPDEANLLCQPREGNATVRQLLVFLTSHPTCSHSRTSATLEDAGWRDLVNLRGETQPMIEFCLQRARRALGRLRWLSCEIGNSIRVGDFKNLGGEACPLQWGWTLGRQIHRLRPPAPTALPWI